MKFETAFSCGDKGWSFDGESVRQVTVGQIRLTYTQSEGVNDGYVDPNVRIAFDNYTPKPAEYEEDYMCVETGIGSGSIYTLNKRIFLTKEACELAYAKDIEDRKRQQEALRAEGIRERKSRISRLRAELAMLELREAA